MKIVWSGRFKVLYNEYGEVERVELDGEVYEGSGWSVSVPFSRVAEVRLAELPEDLLIEPVEKIEDGMIYSLGYGELFTYDVYFGRGFAFVVASARRKFWEDFLGLDAYAEGLKEVLYRLRDEGLVCEEICCGWDNDYFDCSFKFLMSLFLTIERAVEVVRKALSALEAAAAGRALEIALRGLESVPMLEVEEAMRVINKALNGVN